MAFLWQALRLFILGVASCLAHQVHAALSTISLGYSMHSGAETDSIAGASSYHIVLGAESTPGALRISSGIEGHYGAGLVSWGAEVFDATRMGGELKLGLSLHLFSDATMRPILGVNGLAALDLVRSSVPPEGLSTSQTATGFGYEIECGMGITASANSELRLLGVYKKLKMKLVERDIVVDAFALRLGLAY